MKNTDDNKALIADARFVLREMVPVGAGKIHEALDAFERLQAAFTARPVQKLEEKLREQLAALAHEQWSGWMRYLFEQTTGNISDTALIPAWATERWKRQLNTPYAQLTDEEKESDRKEADRVLALVSAGPKPGYQCASCGKHQRALCAACSEHFEMKKQLAAKDAEIAKLREDVSTAAHMTAGLDFEACRKALKEKDAEIARLREALGGIRKAGLQLICNLPAGEYSGLGDMRFNLRLAKAALSAPPGSGKAGT